MPADKANCDMKTNHEECINQLCFAYEGDVKVMLSLATAIGHNPNVRNQKLI